MVTFDKIFPMEFQGGAGGHGNIQLTGGCVLVTDNVPVAIIGRTDKLVVFCRIEPTNRWWLRVGSIVSGIP